MQSDLNVILFVFVNLDRTHFDVANMNIYIFASMDEYNCVYSTTVFPTLQCTTRPHSVYIDTNSGHSIMSGHHHQFLPISIENSSFN